MAALLALGLAAFVLRRRSLRGRVADPPALATIPLSGSASDDARSEAPAPEDAPGGDGVWATLAELAELAAPPEWELGVPAGASITQVRRDDAPIRESAPVKTVR